MSFLIKKTFRGVQVTKDALKVDFENGEAVFSIGNNSVRLNGNELVRLESMIFKLSLPTDRNIAAIVEDDLRKINPPKTAIFTEGVVAQRMQENKEKIVSQQSAVERLKNPVWIMEEPIEKILSEDTEEIPVIAREVISHKI